MVTLSPRDAVRKAGDWVIWMSHLAPEIGKLKTCFHTINSIIRGLSLRPGSTDQRQLIKFTMLSSLPVSQSSSNPRSWVGTLMSVLWPVWEWLQHKVWPDYEGILMIMGGVMNTCKSASLSTVTGLVRSVNLLCCRSQRQSGFIYMEYSTVSKPKNNTSLWVAPLLISLIFNICFPIQFPSTSWVVTYGTILNSI